MLLGSPRAPRLVALALAAAALTLPASPSLAGEPAPLDPRAAELAAGQNAFALDLYARIKDEPGNLLFSAYSIQTSLAMARAGARGETAAQMDRVLRLPANAAPESWKALVASVTTALRQHERAHDPASPEVPVYTVSVANALFGQKGYAFVPGYRDLVASAYGAELRDVDFGAGEAVRKEINDWVLAKTNDRIKDLIPEGLPKADTRLALVNAIHFLAQWAEPFAVSETQDADFTGEGGVKTKVRMMRRTHTYRYVDDGDVHVAVLPYRGDAAEMLLVLPKAVDGLAALEKSLTPERVAKWVGGGGRQKLALALPRFKFEAPTDLTKILPAMGMPDAFLRTKADFTGMANVPGEPLFIGVVLHKAFIAVDEKGTEAAAATVTMKSSGSSTEPLPFVCDHPFLFLVRHRASGALLFVGRLAAPAPESAPAGAGSKPGR